jgi:hypothetical protein
MRHRIVASAPHCGSVPDEHQRPQRPTTRRASGVCQEDAAHSPGTRTRFIPPARRTAPSSPSTATASAASAGGSSPRGLAALVSRTPLEEPAAGNVDVVFLIITMVCIVAVFVIRLRGDSTRLPAWHRRSSSSAAQPSTRSRARWPATTQRIRIRPFLQVRVRLYRPGHRRGHDARGHRRRR